MLHLDPETTLKCYKAWPGCFLKDHSELMVSEFAIERFAAWKLSLKERGYSAESVNHWEPRRNRSIRHF